MKLRLAACAIALALPASAGAALPFRATLSAPTHRPRVNAKWYYTVRVASLRGKPIRATITVQLVDPLGTVHPVDYGTTSKPIRNRPFRGVFRDFAQYPPESRGFRLTFRVIVRALGAKRTLTYWVQPR